jgi:hypothetical protein
VLAYRAIAIWLPAPIGLAALGGLRRTIARWGDEDGPAAAPQGPERDAAAAAWPLPARPEPTLQAAA